jgi:hypothetical protein
VRAAAVRALVLVAALACCGPAFCETSCPVGDDEAARAGGYLAAVEKAIAAAPDCPTAFRRLELCQLGSSGDNALSDVARGKCEPLFLPSAKPAIKKGYAAALKRCDRIAEGNSGSMYQSFAAVCQARAARDFAAKAGVRPRK